MVDDRILNKIKKCLALSQSSEPHEAAAALRQAQKLMEIHGVDQLNLRKSDIGEADLRSKVSVSKAKDWEVALLAMVGKAFGCKLIWTTSNSHRQGAAVFGRYTLVGLKSQVQLAHYTCEVLQRKLMKARAEFVGNLPPLGRSRKTLEADGFCHGWVQAVRRTVSDFALDDGTRTLIEDAVKERTGGGMVKVQKRKAGDYGFNAGHEAGSSESIHRPVAEQERLRITA